MPWEVPKHRESLFKVKKPCKECPFVVGCKPGWLGPDTPQQVIEKVHGEGGYICHMSIEGKPTMDDGHVDPTEHGHMCIGAFMHANISAKSYRHPQFRELQQRLKPMTEEYKSKVLDYVEFLVYHKGDIPDYLKDAAARRKKNGKI